MTETYRIRPAGRHILTIGRELIQNQYAAIVELVKNAYDADSPDVNITFAASLDRSSYSISIEDHGHGMTREIVINHWLVPSTDDKLKRRVSPGGRIMQGRKGIGRYAASLLGHDLLLETVTPDGEKTTVYAEWQSFERAEYLDDVEILVETEETTQPSGTRLTITGDAPLLAEWNERQFDKLRFELKKLISPIPAGLRGNLTDQNFRIRLTIEEFLEGEDNVINQLIEPYPIVELYDYRIAGHVGADGAGLLTYTNNKARGIEDEYIQFHAGSPTGCGELEFDIRVYDRDKESIESLIGRGLKDELGNYVGKLQARQLLNESNGIGVYRNGFRIRPLGDADFDWIKLNEQRIQNPSLRIGSNQVIGYVLIQAEEISHLIEKSARDGLRENSAYDRLKIITKLVIAKLEERRFTYRRKAGLSRPALKVERELEKLFAFDELKRGIRTRLMQGGIDERTADEIIEIISQEEVEKNKIAEDIRKSVAIYQGQATLGKIINVILHEGRRPLNYFRNQIPNLTYWYESFHKTGDTEKLARIVPIAEGISENADVFVKLFGRLDPLAAAKRSERKSILLKKTIVDTFAIFEQELATHSISVKITGQDDYTFTCWRQDIYAIFTNLIDNSIYWMSGQESRKRGISVVVETDADSLVFIDYRDTGPGIDPTFIESGVIFEPEFSTKPDGTGLGLAIAGEAASRNGLDLGAFESDQGAYFRLQPKTEVER